MQQNELAAGYCSKVMARLEADGFTIDHDLAHEDQAFKHVAKRARFELQFWSIVEIIFIVAEFRSLDPAAFWSFSRKYFLYAKKSKSRRSPRGFCTTSICFPVALVSGVNDDVAQAVSATAPPKHLSVLEMPVICDLKSGQLHYYDHNLPVEYRFFEYLERLMLDALSP